MGQAKSGTSSTSPSAAGTALLNQVAPQVQQYLSPNTNPYQPVIQRIAQQTPEQLAAVGNYSTAFGAANTGLGTYGEAQSLVEGAAQPLTQAEIDQYFNPYVNDVVNAAQRQFTLQNAQQQNQVVGSETAQGALGGNRTAVAGALTAGQQAAAEDPIIAGMLQAGYTQQEAMAAQQYQQTPLAAASALQQIGAGQEGAAGNIANLGLGQYGLGTQQQQYYTPGATPSTATLNAFYAEQLAKAGYPIQLTNMAAGDISGLAGAYGSNTTTTPPPPSIFNAVAGLGTFGLGAGIGYKSIFSKRGGRVPRAYGGKVQGLQAGGVPAMPYGASPMSGLGPMPYAGGGSYVPQVGLANIPKLAAAPMATPQDDSSNMFMNALKMSEMGSNKSDTSDNSYAAKSPDIFGSAGGFGDTAQDTLQDWTAGSNAFPVGTLGAAGGRVPRAYGGLAMPSSNRINVPMRGGFGMPSFMSRARGGLAEGGTPDDNFTDEDAAAAAAEPGPTQVAGLNPGPPPIVSGPAPGLAAQPPLEDVPLPQPRPKEADAPPKPWRVAANEWTKAGMSENGVAGVLANVKDESNFDSTLRHPDQPHWGGEAHFAHGLYQEGGQEWNNYANWLRNTHPGADWRDPKLQSEFTAQNLKANYPQVWDRMANAKTKEEAAQAFVSGYLKPAAHFENARLSKYAAGVPDPEDYEKMAFNTTPVGQQRGLMTTTTDAGGIPGVTPIKAPDISGKTGANKTDIALSLMAAGLGMMGSRSPYAGVGIGQGGLQGVQTYEALHKQRVGEAEHQAQLEMQAAGLNQHPQMQQQLFAQQKAQQERQFTQQQGMEKQRHVDAMELEKLRAMRTPQQIIDSKTGQIHNVVPRGDGTSVDILTHEIFGDPIPGLSPTVDPLNPTKPAPATPAPAGPTSQGPGQTAPNMPSNPRNATAIPQDRLASADPGFRTANREFVESGQQYNYASDAPHMEKGMQVPEPVAIGGNSADVLKADAARYLQDGTLPKVSVGKSPVAIGQQMYQRAVKNYAVATAGALGMSPPQIAEAMREGKMMPRFIQGQAGMQTVSIGTAMRHLDTLEQYAKAWNGGDIQAINRLRAGINREFGGDAGTNLETVAHIVGPEIIKAIGVAGGGGEKERQGAADQFTTAKSLDQVQGAIGVTKGLLRGQLEGKHKQASLSGVTDDMFKRLIGEKEYDQLTNIDKEAEGNRAGEAASALPTVKDAVGWDKIKDKKGTHYLDEHGQERVVP